MCCDYGFPPSNLSGFPYLLSHLDTRSSCLLLENRLLRATNIINRINVIWYDMVWWELSKTNTSELDKQNGQKETMKRHKTQRSTCLHIQEPHANIKMEAIEYTHKKEHCRALSAMCSRPQSLSSCARIVLIEVLVFLMFSITSGSNTLSSSCSWGKWFPRKMV